MRKLVFPCLVLLLALPAAALAGRNSPGDGTLSVKDGVGTVKLDLRGALIMRCGRCNVLIDDPVTGDGEVVAYGWDVQRDVGGTKTLYINRDKTDMRLRLIGGTFSARVTGSKVNISAVGKGSVVLMADPTAENPGVYSIDDEGAQPLPLPRTKFQLGTSG